MFEALNADRETVKRKKDIEKAFAAAKQCIADDAIFSSDQQTALWDMIEALRLAIKKHQ